MSYESIKKLEEIERSLIIEDAQRDLFGEHYTPIHEIDE
jgi:hypothetical protein